jgi:hypothetical protein
MLVHSLAFAISLTMTTMATTTTISTTMRVFDIVHATDHPINKHVSRKVQEMYGGKLECAMVYYKLNANTNDWGMFL